MLRIKYNNEFLDIAAAADNELEANSPMFLMDNLIAEYSTPFTIPYSDKNARLLGPVFFSTSIKKKTKLQVEVYKNESFRSNATLVLESAAIRRSARNANASGYLLTGISSFFSIIKDVKLQDMNLGEYTKGYTSAEPENTSNGIGYWQDFQNSWSGQMDFVVAPIRNDNIYNTGSGSRWMNPVARFVTNDPQRVIGSGSSNPFGAYYNTNYNNQNGNTGRTYSTYNILQAPFAPIFPQPFLKAAFTKIFQSVGWTLDYSLIQDFEKIVVFSVYKVDTYVWPLAGIPRTQQMNVPHGSVPSVSFKFADLLPTNINASTFILAICKRYGWIPLINIEKRNCKLFPLKLMNTAAVKDWTPYAVPDLESDFSEEDKIYSFKNNFTGNDAYTSEPDISDRDTTLTVNSRFELPAPTDSYDSVSVFCIRENTWYGIFVDTTDPDNLVRAWAPIKDNIYNDDPKDANTSIETDCTTLAMTWDNYTLSRWGMFPYCSQPFNLDAGIRTLFYHGMVQEVNADGSSGQAPYPYLSSTNRLPNGTVALQWSNTFKHPQADGSDSGIEQFWYSQFIHSTKYAEVKTQVFNLPLHELINYQWNDIILINNIPHLLISYIEKLSQNNYIQAKLKRLNIEA